MNRKNYSDCNGVIYKVQSGDSLYSISRRYNVPLGMLLKANPYADVYNLQIGDNLCIPIDLSGFEPVPISISEPVPMPLTPPMSGQMPDSMLGTMPGSMPGSMPGQMPGQMPSTMPGQMPGSTNNQVPSDRWPMDMNSETEEEIDYSPFEGWPGDMEDNVQSEDYSYSMKPKYDLVSYVVRNNESIGDILDLFDLDFEELLLYNNLENMILKPGIIIRVPNRKSCDFCD